MKTLSLLSVVAFGLAVSAIPAHADDSRALTLTPDIQVLLNQLLKSQAGDQAAESAPVDPPATPAAPSGSKSGGAPSPLRTGGLSTGHLTTGSLTGAPRLTDADWRILFPQKQTGR